MFQVKSPSFSSHIIADATSDWLLCPPGVPFQSTLNPACSWSLIKYYLVVTVILKHIVLTPNAVGVESTDMVG